MQILYVDTSALLKRVLPEREAAPLVEALEERIDQGATLVTSTLTRVEVGRALRRHGGAGMGAFGCSLQGIALAQITDLVTELARAMDPPVLRSLDAIHLATAVALGAHELWTYDDRLAEAASLAGLAVRKPH